MAKHTKEDLRFIKALSKRIKRVRLQHGISRNELARRAGIHKNTMMAIEKKGTGMSICTFLCIATALKMTPPELLGPKDL